MDGRSERDWCFDDVGGGPEHLDRSDNGLWDLADERFAEALDTVVWRRCNGCVRRRNGLLLLPLQVHLGGNVGDGGDGRHRRKNHVLKRRGRRGGCGKAVNSVDDLLFDMARPGVHEQIGEKSHDHLDSWRRTMCDCVEGDENSID